MRLGSVIGRITLSVTVPSLAGGRWLIVSPYSREDYPGAPHLEAHVSKETNLVVYDNIGAGTGQTIGFVEGREAACPFDKAPPIDAINAALVDEIFYKPLDQ